VADLLFIAIVLGLLAVAFKKPGAACGYVLSGIALEQCAQVFVPLANSQNTLCNYLTAGAVLLGFAGRILHDKSALPRIRPMSLWVLGLLAYAYLTVLWSIFPATTMAALNRAVPYLVTFAGVAPLLIRSERDLFHCLTAFMYCSLFALGFLVVFAEWGNRGVIFPGKSYESNPLALAGAAGGLLIVSTLMPLGPKVSARMRYAILAAIVIVTALVFVRTASRGQVLSAILVTLAFSLRQRGGVLLMLAMAVGGAALYMLMPEEVARNAERWDPEQMRDAVDNARINEADRLLTFWSHSSISHQIFGLGHAASQDPRLLGNYPHVVPAEVLAEEGIVGITLFAITIFLGAYTYYRGLRSRDPTRNRMFTAAAALFTFEFLLIWKQGSLLGASALFLLLSLVPREERTRAAVTPAPRRTTPTGVAGLGLGAGRGSPVRQRG
jgi:hypothetical protein